MAQFDEAVAAQQFGLACSYLSMVKRLKELPK